MGLIEEHKRVLKYFKQYLLGITKLEIVLGGNEVTFKRFFNAVFMDNIETYYLTSGYIVFIGIRPVY